MRTFLCAALFLIEAGCLDPRGQYLSPMDVLAPTVTDSVPVGLAGTSTPVPRNAEFKVTFSEEMEPRSLRGGIQLFRGNSPVTLVYTLPAPEPGADDVDRGDVPFEVRFAPEGGVMDANTRHTLVYSTILTDSEGNALAQETRMTFTTEP